MRAGARLNKLEIQAQSDLRPAPGRKSSQGIEFHCQITLTIPNHEKLKNIVKHEKRQETAGFINFSTFKMNFRSADAANHINRFGDQPPRF